MDSEQPTGIPWIVASPRTDGGASDLFALVIGRGWAHTSIAGAGAHAVVAAAVRRELTRPIEISGGGVHEVDVYVEVDLQDTLFVIAGGAAGVRAAAERLDVLLTRPEELVFDVPGDAAQPVAHPFAGWGRELAAWFGVGPASVFADVVPTWSGSVEDLQDALRALRPGAEVAAVGATTVPEVSERLFARAARPAAGKVGVRPTGLQWRTPERTRIPGPVVHLLSARAPGGVVGQTAMTVLVETLQRSFAATCPVRGLYASAGAVGADHLLTITAEPHQDLDPTAAEAAVDAALDALDGLAPEVIESALTGQRDDTVLARRTGLVGVAVLAIRTGRLRSPQQIVEEARAATTDEVRVAIATLREQILLTRGAGEPEVREKVSKAEIPGGSPKSMHSPSMPVPTPVGPRFVRVLVNGRRLTQQRSTTQRGHGGAPQTVMDLDRIVARLDLGTEATTLIDDRDRRIQVLWKAVGFQKRLRRILDAAIPADRAMTLASDGRIAASLSAYKRRAWSIVLGVFGFLALLAVVLVGVAVLETSNDGDDKPGAIIDTTIGQTATLPNGTTITVSDPRLLDDPRNSGSLLVADVRYCAGTVQPSDVRDYEIRNYVAADKFKLFGTNNNDGTVWPPGIKPFDMNTLAAGECLTRQIVFEVSPTDLPEAGVYIQFSNVVNDQVTWRGVQPTR